MSDILFTPAKINGLQLPNRIIMSPMTRGQSPGGVPGENVAAYYAARARGGVGLITTEAVAVQRPTAANHPGIPNLHDPAAQAGWRRVTDAVHAAGGLISAQLWHCGEQQKADPMYTADLPFESPATMSDEDIQDTISAFGRSAAAAVAAGFDGVELHGANGYLIDQFLWAQTNTRTDAWGGDAVARSAFAREVIKAVRAAIGPQFPLSFRFSQFKLRDYAADLADGPDELGRILQPLADAGVDVFHASQRRFWEPEFHGSQLNLAGWAKKLTGKLSISVGSMGLSGPDTGDLLAHTGASAPTGPLDEARERLARGEFDFIAIGRALLTDPDWARKVREGRDSELKGFDVTSLFSLVGAEPTEAA
ncbi:MAG: 12-oxophytodienoate reductase [Luteibacter sp.]